MTCSSTRDGTKSVLGFERPRTSLEEFFSSKFISTALNLYYSKKYYVEAQTTLVITHGIHRSPFFRVLSMPDLRKTNAYHLVTVHILSR